MNNTPVKNRIILDLFAGTGAWSEPYRRSGYDVRIVTLPSQNVSTYEPPANIYGILAAPPCTEFSTAKASAPRNFADALKLIQRTLEIIWISRIQNQHLKFWCIENPVGLLRQFIGLPAYTFQPWWFGDFHTKKTDLWGYFNPPKRTVVDRPLLVERTTHGVNSRHFSEPARPAEYKHLKLKRADLRAITPPCFAEAFFKANK